MFYTSRMRCRNSTTARFICSRRRLAVLVAGLTGCDASTAIDASASASTVDATTGATTGEAAALTSEATTSEVTTSHPSPTPIGCAKNVVLMGYWPPSNEMLRPWSADPKQNPDGWIVSVLPNAS